MRTTTTGTWRTPTSIPPGISTRARRRSASRRMPGSCSAYLYWGADLARGVAQRRRRPARLPARRPGTRNDPSWRQVDAAHARRRGLVRNRRRDDSGARRRVGRGSRAGTRSRGNRPGFAYQVRANVTTEVADGIQRRASAPALGRAKLGVTVANVQAGRGYNRHGGWTLLVAWESPTVGPGATSPSSTASTSCRCRAASSSWSARSTSPASRRRRAARSTRTRRPGPTRATARSPATISRSASSGSSMRPAAASHERPNPVDNFFNSSISHAAASTVGGRTPAYVNQLGFDLRHGSTCPRARSRTTPRALRPASAPSATRTSSAGSRSTC